MTKTQKHFVVIDPAVRVSEVDTYNRIVRDEGIRATYHMPALTGQHTMCPELNVLDKITGVLVFGSSSSVNDNLAWQFPLREWLEKAIDKKIPVLGFCFGHQLLAHIFGSKVGYARADEQKNFGFQTVTMWANPLSNNKTIEGNVFVSHKEEVKSIPSGWELIASREECQIEGLKHKTLPLFSMQSHPEATIEFLKNQSTPYTYPVQESDFHFGYTIINAFVNFCNKPG